MNVRSRPYIVFSVPAASLFSLGASERAGEFYLLAISVCSAFSCDCSSLYPLGNMCFHVMAVVLMLLLLLLLLSCPCVVTALEF